MCCCRPDLGPGTNRTIDLSFSWYRQDIVESLGFLACLITFIIFQYIQWKSSPLQKFQRKIFPKTKQKGPPPPLTPVLLDYGHYQSEGLGQLHHI